MTERRVDWRERLGAGRWARWTLGKKLLTWARRGREAELRTQATPDALGCRGLTPCLLGAQ